MKRTIFYTVLFITSSLFSQEKLEYIDNNEIFDLASQSYNEDDPAKALEYLNKISKNDSSYCSILTSKAFYLLQLEQYDKVISYADEGLKNKFCIAEHDAYYINKSVAYIGLKKYEDAIKLVDDAIKIYPNAAKLWYNKGVALENLGELKKAVDAYKKTIILNPYYPSPHLRLGNICFKQKRMSQALMCYNMYLLLKADSDSAVRILKQLTNIASVNNPNKRDTSVIISTDDESFDELDLIIDQKLALNEGYETGNKIDDALVKQNHVLINQLQDIEGNGGLWSTKYIPFFKWIRDNNLFNDFTYLLFYSSQNQDHQKLIKKNSDEIAAFYESYRAKWQEIVALNYDAESDKTLTYYFNDTFVSAIGEFVDDNTVGYWKFYDEDGRLKSEGDHNDNGDRIGTWTWYYPNGKRKELITYENGKVQGNFMMWHENGKVNVESYYNQDSLHGEYKYYLKSGALNQKNILRMGN